MHTSSGLTTDWSVEMSELLGENKGVASPEALAMLRERQELYGSTTQRIAVYQNQALDSAALGHLVFLIVGEGKTFSTAPNQLPDGSYGPGWKYRHVGYLDLALNQLEKTDG